MQDSRASGQTGAMDAEAFAAELRKWWSFDDYEQHTHSWHSREDFIEKRLPSLIRALRAVLPALSPPAIGDGEIMQELAAEYVNPESALRLLREGAMPAMQAKKVLAACARIAERAGASDRWQPIESVPAQYKDEGRELYVCRFGKETAPTYNVVFWDNNIGRWAFAEDMDRSYHPDFPTHWQLPEPPVALHTDEKKGG